MIETLNDLLGIRVLTFEIICYFKNNILLSKNLYDQLIESSLSRGLDKTKLEYYCEKHHIIPKSVGGEDDDKNYVLLTPREHILAHLLLYVTSEDSNRLKLLAAFKLMIEAENVKDLKDLSIDLTSIEYARKEFSEHLKIDNPMKDPEIAKKQHEAIVKNNNMDKIKKSLSERMKVNNPMSNKETIEKMRQSKLGKKASKEARENQSKARLGKQLSKEHKKRISEARKANPIHLTEESKDIMRISKNSDIISPDEKRFDSLTEAATELGISRTTLKDWIVNSPEKGWKMVPKTEESKKLRKEKLSKSKRGKMPSGKDNSRSTKIIGPEGKIYDTLKDAAKEAGVNRSTLNRWIRGKMKSKDNHGWSYYEE